MKKLFALGIIVALFSFTISASAQSLSDTTHMLSNLQKSRSATKQLLSTLRTLLALELSRGGAVRAINVCADSAQSIGERIQDQHGLSIRRVSEKWRNPKDKPDSYESKQLKMLASLHAKKNLTDTLEVYGIVNEDSLRVFRYMRPIMVSEMCLNCHGGREKMKDLIYSVVRSRYPNDKAVDYKAGELRGAVSVKILLRK
jgi:hypothetical protein